MYGAILRDCKFMHKILKVCVSSFSTISSFPDWPLGVHVASHTIEFLHSRQQLRSSQRLISESLLSNLRSIVLAHEADLISSVSHSQVYVVCTVAQKSKYTRLGVDVEKCISDVRAQKLAQRILTPTEMIQSQKSQTLTFSQFVTVCFALKEASFKALNICEQKQMSFQKFCIEWNDVNPSCVRVEVSLNPHNHFYLEGVFYVLEDMILCCVFEKTQIEL